MFTRLYDVFVTTPAFFTILGIAMLLGCCLALVFSFRCHHAPGFIVAISLLPMTVALVILLINGNAGTGIAVAGTFTLVRFRSIPGTGREIAGLFTAMAVGLALGMGYALIAVTFFLASAAFVLILTISPLALPCSTQRILRITIPENTDYNGLFDDVFAAHRVRAKLERVKSSNMGTLLELTYAITLPHTMIDTDFVNQLRVRNSNLTVIIGSAEQREAL